MLKHKGAVASSVERLTSGGLSMLMLVSFYLCHCSLLCYFDFLVFIKCYLSNNKKEKKIICRFFALWPMSKIFEGKCFVCFLILCRKMSLLSIEMI